MKKKLPKTDSIRKLAEFWDTHDLTDFEDVLEEVAEPVFTRANAARRGSAKMRVSDGWINVFLKAREAQAVERLAQSKGISSQELVRAWVQQKIAGRRNGRTAKR